MNNVRQPAVAGIFYPSDPTELRAQIADYLAAAASDEPVPKAVIAPHAGYMYSGPVAASAYVRVARGKGLFTRVVLLGPAHRVAFEGLAASGARAFATPLGEVPLDITGIELALSVPQVRVYDEAHRQEHSIEVQLPFLQETLGAFRLVPLVVGDADAHAVAEVLEILWNGGETLIVISSDLSHYHDYATARAMDQATSRAIEALRPQDIAYEQACGRNPVNGLLHAARVHGLRARAVDVRNSGDTAGPRDRVVGYGAYVFG